MSGAGADRGSRGRLALAVRVAAVTTAACLALATLASTASALPTTSTTTLVCAPESLPAGASSSCTATVTDMAGSGAGEPTGTVSFTSTNSAGTFSEASCTLTGNGDGTSSSCPVSYSQTETGTPELTASFAGGGAFAAGEGHATLTFTQRTTAVSVSCAPSRRALNLETSCTAIVSDNSEGTAAVPTGTVSFVSSDTKGIFEDASCTLASEENGTSSSCAVNYTQPDVGEPTIEASYAGEALHTGATATTTVVFTTNTTTLACAPESPAAGASSSCTATVTAIAASGPSEPTGTVSFTSTNSAGTFSEASCTLTGNGNGTSSSCALSYSQTEMGTPELTASFAGAEGVAAGEGHATLTFTQRTTAVSVSCAPSPRAVNLQTSCTASVSDNSEGTAVVPTGTVSFVSNDTEGIFEDASCALVSEENGTGSSCAVSYTQPDLSEPTIEASYAGDALHTGATATTTVDFTNRATSTTVSCEPSPLALGGASTTCTSTVTDVESGGTPNVPTGTVEYTSENTAGTFSASTCTLLEASASSSSCSVEYIQSEAGSPTITGTYSGDANESPSSGGSSVTFEKRTTTTELTCTPSEPPLGTPTTCTVTIKDTSSGTTSAPAGSISFILNGDGIFSSRKCTLVAASASSSSCSVEYTQTYRENPELIAEYTPSAGDDHEKSEGSYVLHPGNPLPHETSTTVVCTPGSLAAGTATSCTATVTDNHADPYQATGTVSFTASGGSGQFHPESCSLDPSGAATSSCKISYTPETAGGHTISASYVASPASDASSGETSISVSGPHSTSTAVSCTPSSLQVGAQTTCGATVIDTSANAVSPSGVVSVSASDGGAVSPSSCTLKPSGGAAATCSVTYTPKAAGSPTVTATLQASPADSSSSGTTVLSVSALPVAQILPPRVITPPPAPVAQAPSNVFTFGKVVLNKRRGTATIEIFLPDAGKLVLSGAGVKSVSKSVHGKTKVTLTLRLSTKAAKQLKRSHRRKTKITVKFTPTGGVTRTAHKTVTLVLNAKKTKKKGK
jgi:hypothetical protein